LTDDPQAFVAEPFEEPSAAHLLGTNGQGQDVLALTLVGTANSLGLAMVTAVFMTALGIIIGISAGYWGGRIDLVLSFLTNITLVLPGLPLTIVIAAFLPSGPWTLFLVLVLTSWAWNARVFRALAQSLRSKDFITAARGLGESSMHILLAEMVPNFLSPVLSALIGSAIYAIAAQVGLEFLGLGDMNRVSWGTNLYWASNDAALLTESWWIFVPTGLAIALVSFALALMNEAVDELSNPTLRAERLWHRRFHGRLETGFTPLQDAIARKHPRGPEQHHALADARL
jgi:peptide/nickel transport system permease protein